jgi:hypothetical protein
LPTYQDSVRIPHIDQIGLGALHFGLGFLMHARVQPGEWGPSGEQMWNGSSYKNSRICDTYVQHYVRVWCRDLGEQADARRAGQWKHLEREIGVQRYEKTSYHEVTSIHMSKHVRRTKHKLSVTLQLTLRWSPSWNMRTSQLTPTACISK